jgi:uncharacterized protein (TIGR00288 family)
MSTEETRNMALFCDFENIALGTQAAQYAKFNINRVLEKLLLKGNIIVKKAYCDWARYRDFKAAMHEASFELIEIPHVRQTGKNSADIRMVVDALDLCYTKPHIDTFVIISGDSDFSPLVSKLRENSKIVIGVGVKNSTSDLLIANCDEFIYYDDLVREETNKTRRRTSKAATPKSVTTTPAPSETNAKKPAADNSESEQRKLEALDLVMETLVALREERGDQERIWGSMIKQALRRQKPGFNESYYGFSAFSELLNEAEKRGLITLERDPKSGGSVVHMSPSQKE